MKTCIGSFIMFAFLVCSNAIAQTDIAGTWQGKLTIDSSTAMTIQFTINKKADGSGKLSSQKTPHGVAAQ